MALRRFAHAKNASVAVDPSSPLARKSQSVGTGTPSTPTTPSPLSPMNGQDRTPASPSSPLTNGDVSSSSRQPLKMLPVTPRRVQIAHAAASPFSSPSLSASVPFDWAAARSRRPPPYGSPAATMSKAKKRQSLGGGATGAVKKFVRKKSLKDRIMDIPSWIAFEIALFPQNILPQPKTLAVLAGGALHVVHLFVRIAQGRTVSNKQQWGDEVWFDWPFLMTILLVLTSFLNGLYLFTRIRVYHFHSRPDPVASPNASFVPITINRSPPAPPSIMTQIRRICWSAFISSWRFLLNLSPSKTASTGKGPRTVQQLEAWAPGELELGVFSIYSPAHALLWMATTASNWILMGLLMGLLGAQMQALTKTYERLIKDKAIIAAEVMHEYDEKFVYPRVHPIRKDAAVMTHESEMVNVWE